MKVLSGAGDGERDTQPVALDPQETCRGVE